MDLGLRGKVALVTGGTSGIGLAVAGRFLEEGAAVAISGRDAARLDAAVAELGTIGGDVLGIAADMGRPEEVARLVGDAIGRFGRLDVVVSNAGTHLAGTLEEISVDRLAEHLRTKVLGLWEIARQALPHMRRQGGGRLIVIIGQAGKVPHARTAASGVSNAAQHACVKALADHLGPDNILVTAVCPSRITSPLTGRLQLAEQPYLGRSLEQQESRWGDQVPLGRWGDPDDVANAVLFLASARASFITGANIDVDGGYQRSIL